MWKLLLLVAIAGGIYGVMSQRGKSTESVASFAGFGETRLAMSFPNGRELEIVMIEENPALEHCDTPGGGVKLPDFCQIPDVKCKSKGLQCKTGEPTRYRSMLAKQPGEVAYAHFASTGHNVVMAFWGTTAEEARTVCMTMQANYRGAAPMTCM